MPDPVDVGNEKAFAIQEGQLLRQSEVKNKYVIAYRSGDGDKLTTTDFSGTKDKRMAFMASALGIDPTVSDNWAFAQWSHSEQLWVLAAGNGEMKQKLKQYMSDPANFEGRKQRTR
jgi:hypothetical protein